ncbi:MAG: type II secretion system F family protein [Armatimonadetes bacterium]|nr:type II secretion system F family protein [Armatimonadota bacterium]
MPVFEYQATDAVGKQVRGTIIGDSLDLVAGRLAEQGLKVSQLGMAQSAGDPLAGFAPAESPRGAIPETRIPPTDPRSRLETDLLGPLVGGVALSKLQFMFRQLGTMLNAGIEIRQALETLGAQSQGKLREVLFELRDHTAAGRPMSVGMQRYPEVFSPLMMAMVRAGEQGGMQGDMALRLADYIQRDIELRNLIRRETFYPKLVFGASILIILATNLIINMVAPGKSGITAESLIWFVVAGLVAAGFFFRKYALKNPAVKYSWDAFLLGVPYIGTMVHGFAMAMFGRAFGALYEAGVPTREALLLGADSCANEAVRARVYPIVHRLGEGQGIYETFAESGAFTPIVLDMVKTGEMTGNMHDMLIKVSEYYEDEGTTKARQAASLYGVGMLIVVGIYVAYIVIKFYTGYASGAMSNLGE